MRSVANKSKIVETTLALLPSSGDHDTSPALPDLDAIDWREFIAFTTAHFVLQALAAPLQRLLPPTREARAALDFIAAFHESNRVRNRLLASELAEITRALNGLGVEPVALKGATFLVDQAEVESAAGWRFMGDLDLLIPDVQLRPCVDELRRRGFIPTDAHYEPAQEAHFPPLLSPCGQFSVELHTRLFARSDFDISITDLVCDAAVAPLGCARLLVPSREHRLMHLLAHAQLHNRNYASHRLILKDVLDLTMMAGPPIGDDRARDMSVDFATPYNQTATGALLAAWRICHASSSFEGHSGEEIKWARRAHARLTWGQSRAWLNLPYDMCALEWHRAAHDRDHLANRLRLVTSPTRCARAVQAWYGKQRQRLWA